MKIEKNPKRLAIYFFFDKEGIVDRYVPYFLKDLKKNVSDLLIVSNGAPTKEGEQTLKEYGELFVRDNTGFDVWAYKEALEHYGWEALEQYDEVILLNSTIMGPVFPLKETFDRMDARDVDFWGMTMYFRQDRDSSGCCCYGYIPDHIQSHFIACRKSLVKSREFHEYWENMPMIHSYWESVGKHEMVFTKYFEDLGFKSALSVDMEDLRGFSSYPLMMCPTKLITERRCPIFKRRMFFHEPKDFMSQTAGEQTRQLFDFLETETDYDTDFIWESILSRYNHADIVKDLNLNFVLSEKYSDVRGCESALRDNKTALILYLQYEELFEQSFSYASSMPEQADVYIITDTPEKKAKAEKVFKGLSCNRLELKVMQEGGDVAALLVGMKDVIMQYSIACFVQDMESRASSVILGYEKRCFGSVLAGKDFVRNVILAFHRNPRLGFLAPPPPNHGPYFTNIGNEWRIYYPKVKELMQELGINVPVSEDRPPVCPLETVFWFRPEALKLLFSRQWKAKEFQIEAEYEENILACAVERLYPFAVQQSGFYPAVLMSDETAQTELENLSFYVREYNTILMNHGIENYHQYMCETLNRTVADGLSVQEIKSEMQRALGSEEYLKRELEAFKKDREVIENMSLAGILKFWLRNQRNRMKAAREKK